jgi:apolipoprotein N-acyltransferase
MAAAPDTAAAAPAAARFRLVRPASALVRLALALSSGALLATAFAPLSFWPLAILCPAVLMWLWQDAPPREAARLGFWFTFATFVCGTYWLYFSVHILGHAPIWLAFFLMLGLAAIMGLYHAGLGYVVARFLPARGLVRWLLALPAAWMLLEWWRGWFLSGFSWLSLGYSQTDTWLTGYAPIAGIYGLSLLLLVSAGALVALALADLRGRLVALAVLILTWALGAALYRQAWTHPAGAPVTVAVIQGAIPEDEKWQENNRETTLSIYQSLTERVLGAQIIVWPEAAIPDLANNVVPFLTSLSQEARAHGSSLVLGVLRADGPDDNLRVYNSVLALGGTVAWYDKRHLVPFGEFFPVPSFVRSWMRLMSLPYADFTRGAANQAPLPAGGLKLGATICYEDAYGASMLGVVGQADALVNITNDAWFGHSTARGQHFQIARLRAIEQGRYLVRAANDGISGVIGPNGEVIALAPEFVQYALVSKIVPMKGLTPYAYVGNYLAVILAALVLAYGLWVRNDRRARAGKEPASRPTEADVSHDPQV